MPAFIIATCVLISANNFQGSCRKERQVLKKADYRQNSACGATVSIYYSWSANTHSSTSLTTSRQSRFLNMLTDDRWRIAKFPVLVISIWWYCKGLVWVRKIAGLLCLSSQHVFSLSQIQSIVGQNSVSILVCRLAYRNFRFFKSPLFAGCRYNICNKLNKLLFICWNIKGSQ